MTNNESATPSDSHGETAQELNEKVARALGWTIKPGKYWGLPPGETELALSQPYPNYVHDIRSAWEILETLVSQGFGVAVDKDDSEEAKLMEPEYRGWHCNVSDAKGRHFSDGFGATAPEAIVRAFLKLKHIS